MAQKKTVSLILPVYGQYSLLPDWVRTFNNQKYSDFNLQLIVVDDCSPINGNNRIMLNKIFFGVADKIIFNRENLGFAGAINAGLPYAMGDYVILGNTDAYYKNSNAIQNQFKEMENKDTVIMGCRTITPDDKIHHDGIYFSDNGNPNHVNLGEPEEFNKNYTYSVYAVTGCGMMIEKNFLSALGGLCNNYNGYGWEDVDLCMEAKKQGYKIYCTTKTTLIHMVGQSYKLKNQDNIFKQQFFKNRDKFKIKWEQLLYIV